MKMLMILSRDRSNHTIICMCREEGNSDRKQTGSETENKVSETEAWDELKLDTWRNLCSLHFGSKSAHLGPEEESKDCVIKHL